MLDFTDILVLLLFAAVVAFWADSLRARERALSAARRACERAGVQLLDETVALARLGLARNDEGRLTFARAYRFEFSLVGDERRSGQVLLTGGRIDYTRLELPEGGTLDGVRHPGPFREP